MAVENVVIISQIKLNKTSGQWLLNYVNLVIVTKYYLFVFNSDNMS